MKILIFTEGTVLMHKSALGHRREEIVEQVQNEDKSIHDYASYIPIGNAVNKISKWANQGAEISYLTSCKKVENVEKVRSVLLKYSFPSVNLYFRRDGEEYKDIAERIMPDILIEDDCESIGGENEMTITHISENKKKEIKSVPVKEFSGIDHLPDNTSEL